MMMKKIFIFLIMALMIIAPLQVQAEHYPEEDTDWEVTFNGKKLEDNFGEDDITQLIGGMQPGDSADFEVTLTNDYSKKADFYMENSVIASFEDETVMEALQYGGYVYELSYEPAAGGDETIIYSSKKVGGEDNEDLVGLHEATDALDKYFYLESIAPGASATVKLHIELDGESQANIYQDTIGKIRLDFAVELPVEGKRVIYRHLPGTGVSAVRFEQIDMISKIVTMLCLIVMIVSAFILIFVRKGGSDDVRKA